MKKINIEASLPVTFLREGNQFVAYSPALDISTSAGSFEQVKRRFGEVVHIFLEECVKMGTLSRVLSDLGWKRQNNGWNPPIVVAQDVQSIRIPAIA